MYKPDEERAWRAYLSSLASNRTNISTEQLWQLLLSQNYLCALSGVRMTCTRVKGQRFWTNASVDRIIAGSEYRIANVQLVCAIVNVLKRHTPQHEFIRRCHLAVLKGKATDWQWRVSNNNLGSHWQP